MAEVGRSRIPGATEDKKVAGREDKENKTRMECDKGMRCKRRRRKKRSIVTARTVC